MASLYKSCRVFLLVAMVATLSLLALPGTAQDTAAPEAEWQEVISGQIQAFRDRDAPKALSFAGRGFHAAFPNPETFFVAIMSSGYAPIMESRSHSFGDFWQLADTVVVQKVRLVGPTQELYEAMYQLLKEEDGWRVQGVQLYRSPGLGV